MTFIIALVATAVVCCLLREPMRKIPWLFYLIAVAFVIFYFASTTIGVPRPVQMALLVTMRKCMLPLALFVIVMFTGVLPPESAARHWLQPIRPHLSIIACILALGHMVQYLSAYIPRIARGGAVASNAMAMFVIAIVLFVLLAVLGVTSFNFVRKRMNGVMWKNIQRFAYLFYGLIYLHIAIMLLPAVAKGVSSSVQDFAVYTVIFGAYLVLRLVRYNADRKAGVQQEATQAKSQAEASEPPATR